MTGQGLEALRFFVELKKRQTQMQKDRITKAFAEGPIPVDDATLEAFQCLFVTDAIEVLRSHPGFVLEDKVRSLKTTIGLFARAADDLIAALDRFDAFSRRSEFQHLQGEEELERLESSIRKELYAYCGLAYTLQELRRRVPEPPDFREKLIEHFGGDGLHDFVCKLRKAMHHIVMVEADWQIQNLGAGATSHYVLDVHELLTIEDTWNESSRKFLGQAGRQIDVREISLEYRTRVKSFYDWFLHQFEEDVPIAVADCRRCWNEHRRLAMRQAIGLQLSLIRGKAFDPYPHLHKYLRPDQLAEVEALPRHSREQVDLIITMADRLGACDDGLRAAIYRLFGVPE